MNKNLITVLSSDPQAYETTNIAFWDDAHISQSMLQAHLNPNADGASRKHSYIEKSVDWISSLSQKGQCLLDLGCGPGLYAEKLNDKGYHITGIDFSKRSIEYASQLALQSGRNIDYHYQNYLTIDYQAEFDIVILIYCDFGVLPSPDRALLLDKVYKSLKPGGRFIVDVFTSSQYDHFKDEILTSYEDGGFWRCEPYVCIQKNKRYEDALFLEQYTIITDADFQTYNLWNHAFTEEELRRDLQQAGFESVEFFDDVTGKPVSQYNATLCAVAKK